MAPAQFDLDAAFGDDYLHFYGEMLEATSDDDAEEIVSTLGLIPGARVLDAPGGHGRIANRLARRVMTVTSIDRSRAFIDKARADAVARGVDVDHRVGDIAALPSEWTGRFDAVINWFSSFGYFDDTTNRRVLAEFRRVLCPGGQLLVESLHRDWLVRHSILAPAAVVTEVGDDLMIDRTTFDSITGRSEVERIVVRDGSVRRHHWGVRHLTVQEFAEWLADAGFADVRASGRGGQRLTPDSRRIVVVATAM